MGDSEGPSVTTQNELVSGVRCHREEGYQMADQVQAQVQVPAPSPPARTLSSAQHTLTLQR